MSLLGLPAVSLGTNTLCIEHIFKFSIGVKRSICAKTFLRRDVTVIARIL